MMHKPFSFMSKHFVFFAIVFITIIYTPNAFSACPSFMYRNQKFPTTDEVQKSCLKTQSGCNFAGDLTLENGTLLIGGGVYPYEPVTCGECPTGQKKNKTTNKCEKSCDEDHLEPGSARVNVSSNSLISGSSANTCYQSCSYDLSNVSCDVPKVGPGTNGSCLGTIGTYKGECNLAPGTGTSGGSSGSDPGKGDPGSGVDPKPDPGSDSASTPASNPGTGSNPGNASSPGTGSNPGSGTGTNPGSGTGSNPGNGSGSDPGTGNGNGSSGDQLTGSSTVPNGVTADDLYTPSDLELSDVVNNFITNIQDTPIFTSIKDNFTVNVSGSCPNWSIPSVHIFSYMLPSIPVDMFCSSGAYTAYAIMKVVLIAVATWAAFKVAIL